MERLQDALQLGQEFLFGRYALYSFPHSRRFLTQSQEKTFAHVLKALSMTLTVVWADSSQDIPTLYIDEFIYEELRSLLETCRRLATPSFRRLKKQAPPIPIWGADTTYLKLTYEANDFEILGACFR